MTTLIKIDLLIMSINHLEALTNSLPLLFGLLPIALIRLKVTGDRLLNYHSRRSKDNFTDQTSLHDYSGNTFTVVEADNHQKIVSTLTVQQVNGTKKNGQITNEPHAIIDSPDIQDPIKLYIQSNIPLNLKDGTIIEAEYTPPAKKQYNSRI